jgi:hypothetical protein
MNYLNAVFWDYPELTDPDILRQRLQQTEKPQLRQWILTRFLEYGRVVDTLAFFSLETIVEEFSQLHLSPHASKKWKRMIEVYGHTSRK